LPQNFITLHNIGQKYLADKGEKAATANFWDYHALCKPLKGKVETYVKEHKHRVGILKDTPRAAEDQQQEVVGLFRNYDAGASLNNQEAPAVEMKLAFSVASVEQYSTQSALIASSMAKLTGKSLVKQFVTFCACEVKFLFGCSVPWDKLSDDGQSAASADQESAEGSEKTDPASASSSPKPAVSQKGTTALSSGDEDGEDTLRDGDDNESDASGSGESHVEFTLIDPEDVYACDWTEFKYPVAKDFVPRFKEAHAVAALFHLNAELAAKFPVLNGQINTGWIAHYKKPIHVDQILKPPTVGELGWEDDEVEWLEQTVRYYVEPMTPEQRAELGITPEQARRILKKGTDKVRRALPAARLTLSSCC
jgi:hypothetical protein